MKLYLIRVYTKIENYFEDISLNQPKLIPYSTKNK